MLPTSQVLSIITNTMRIPTLICLATLSALVAGELHPPGYTCYWEYGRYQCTNKPLGPQPITKTITTTVRNKPTTVKMGVLLLGYGNNRGYYLASDGLEASFDESLET
ncbi:hypothetical protein GE09DRAFT_1071484 [Coniochaeta sp. 2T2.1]|nr:hypothetical protein GE09DRAFT_1071484 [Coniochaeta sp. 2T2.1]